jgi:hypothetical protein
VFDAGGVLVKIALGKTTELDAEEFLFIHT